MGEIEHIVQAYQKAHEEGVAYALATVVQVNGSAYRRPGAKMLIRQDGNWFGAISGGCLEGDALRKAREIMVSGIPRMLRYDTVNEDSAKSLGIGLGCEGIIDVLIEPASGSLDEYLRYLERINTASAEGGVETKISESGDQILRRYATEHEVQEWKAALRPGRKTLYHQDADYHYFREWIPKPIRLFLFGAGYDAVPVAELAAKVGWKVIVNDDCAAHLIPKRFACADAMVCGTPGQLSENYTFDERSAALLISHNFEFDLKALHMLAKTDIPYIGIMGPAKRAHKLYEHLETEFGYTVADSLQSRVFAPVGLDTGAETASEIAVSIISEIMAFFNRASGQSLRLKKGPIHERSV